MTTDDASLRATWQQLQARRAAAVGEALLPLETIAALAASDADDDERATALDRVFAHPVMAAEYALLRDLVEQQRPDEVEALVPPPPAVPRRRYRSLVAAAAMVVVTAGVVVLRARQHDALRSGADAVRLVAPAEGEAAASFIWRAVPEAVAYDLEIVAPSGALLARVRTVDTTAALAVPLAAEGDWRVTAELRDGRLVASPTRRVRP